MAPLESKPQHTAQSCPQLCHPPTGPGGQPSPGLTSRLTSGQAQSSVRMVRAATEGLFKGQLQSSSHQRT